MSGYSKLTMPFQNFLVVIHSYDMIYGQPATLLAQILPWFEFIAGVFLLLGLWSRAALILTWFMNLMFILALGQGVLRRLPLGDCGCFGDSIHMKPEHMLIVDIVLTIAILYLNKHRRVAFKFSLDNYFEGDSRDVKKGR
jgi:uncharacterized membrane protein YphA (DoxX/SURF4 family)